MFNKDTLSRWNNKVKPQIRLGKTKKPDNTTDLTRMATFIKAKLTNSDRQTNIDDKLERRYLQNLQKKNLLNILLRKLSFQFYHIVLPNNRWMSGC